VTTSATPHLFWITSRAAGIVALVLASLAVSLGLLMSTKLLRRRGPDLLAVHEVLSISTIVAIVVHGLALVGDQYLHPSLVDIAIPFTFSYKTGWTSLGIIAGWGMALLGLSYYARRWIGAKRWRSLHRLTAVVWLAGLVHAVGMGTDAGQVWFLAMLAIVAAPALALLVTRLARSAQPPAPSTAGTRGDVRHLPARPVPVASAAPERAGSDRAATERAGSERAGSGRAVPEVAGSDRAGPEHAARPARPARLLQPRRVANHES
jgi:sulfoxide reductase heme-binding subunit YedZ